jgi:hypothetical protein
MITLINIDRKGGEGLGEEQDGEEQVGKWDRKEADMRKLSWQSQMSAVHAAQPRMSFAA